MSKEDRDVDYLVEMGFEKKYARMVYLRNNGNVDAALDDLLKSKPETSEYILEFDAPRQEKSKNCDNINPKASLQDCIAELVNLGFDAESAKKALEKTGQKSTQVAVDAIFELMEHVPEKTEINERSPLIETAPVTNSDNRCMVMVSPPYSPPPGPTVTHPIFHNAIKSLSDGNDTPNDNTPDSPRSESSNFSEIKRILALKLNGQPNKDDLTVISHTKMSREDNFVHMLNMGFNADDARESLNICDHDLLQASSYLLERDETYKETAYQKDIKYLMDLGYDEHRCRFELCNTHEIRIAEGNLFAEKNLVAKKSNPDTPWMFDPELPIPRNLELRSIKTVKDLPKDDIFLILGYLNLPGNLNASLINKEFNKASRSNIVWNTYLPETFVYANKTAYFKLKESSISSTNLSLEYKEDEVGLQKLYYTVQKAKKLVERKTYLQNSINGHGGLLDEGPIVHVGLCNPEWWGIWVPLLVVWVLSMLTAIVVVPLCVSFFPNGYWWLLAFIPFAIPSVYTIVSSLVIFPLAKWSSWPFYTCGSKDGNNIVPGDDEINLSPMPYMFWLQSFVFGFLTVGLVLVIPGARDVGLWRIYFIPFVIFHLYASFVASRYLGADMAMGYDIYGKFVMSILYVIYGILFSFSVIFVACKMDYVPMFQNVYWSVHFIPVLMLISFVVIGFTVVVFGMGFYHLEFVALLIGIPVGILTGLVYLAVMSSVILLGLWLDNILIGPFWYVALPIWGVMTGAVSLAVVVAAIAILVVVIGVGCGCLCNCGNLFGDCCDDNFCQAIYNYLCCCGLFDGCLCSIGGYLCSCIGGVFYYLFCCCLCC